MWLEQSSYSSWSCLHSQSSPMQNGRVCSVSGLIRSNTWHGHITTLPPGCRPSSRLIFGGNVHIKSARIDVLENGAVVYVTGKAHWEWLSLDGIKFIARKWCVLFCFCFVAVLFLFVFIFYLVCWVKDVVFLCFLVMWRSRIEITVMVIGGTHRSPHTTQRIQNTKPKYKKKHRIVFKSIF